MLYELVGIARCGAQDVTKDAAAVVRQIGRSILANRGVVRRVENWGVRALPRVWNKNRQRHIVAAHFYLKFDASPAVQREVMRALQTDARVLRGTVVRAGGTTVASLRER